MPRVTSEKLINDRRIIELVGSYREDLRRDMEGLPVYSATEWAALMAVKVGQLTELAMRFDNGLEIRGRGGTPLERPDEIMGALRQGFIELAAGSLDAIEGLQRDNS